MAQSRRVSDALVIKEDNTAMVEQAIKRLANTTVMVGIPSDDEQPHNSDKGIAGPSKRTDTDEVNNADLGYIHETGSPANHLPPRPWLRPGVVSSRNDWERYMRQAGKAAFQGELQVMDKALHAAGLKAVSAIKKRITDHIAPELADATIAARLRKNPAPAGAVISASDFTPLIDTSQFYNSISYVIRYRGKK
jgi:hypothetical protein